MTRERRMLGKSLSTSRKYHRVGEKLKNTDPILKWKSKAIFPLLVAHQDDYGKLEGDPPVVRAKILPLEDDLTNEDVRVIFEIMHDEKLIVWYKIGGESYIYIPQSYRFQTFHGIQKQDSRIPDPPEEELIRVGEARNQDRLDSEPDRVLSEEKGSKEKKREDKKRKEDTGKNFKGSGKNSSDRDSSGKEPESIGLVVGRIRRDLEKGK